MAKRCKKCKVPLEGFFYRLIAAKIFGLRPRQKILSCAISARIRRERYGKRKQLENGYLMNQN